MDASVWPRAVSFGELVSRIFSRPDTKYPSRKMGIRLSREVFLCVQVEGQELLSP